MEIIQQSTTFIKNFSNFALGNVRPDKRRRKNIYLNEIVRNVFKALEQSLDEKKVTPDLSDVEDSVASVRAFEIDWESILINLITNSIHAMERKTGNGRIIKVAVRNDKNNVLLTFSDSGCGIESGTEDAIYLPTFSTRRNNRGTVVGTGMGLSIVKTFVEEHSDGHISGQK